MMRRTTARRLCGTALAAFMTAAAMGAAPAAGQQNMFSVVAKVNDVAISGYDVEQRARFLALEPDAPRQRLTRIALEGLISDELKLQEARSRGVSISVDEVLARVGEIAGNNNMNLEQFQALMGRAGIDFETVLKRTRADLLWRELVTTRFRDRMRPNAGEIETLMEQNKFLDVRQVVVPIKAGSDTAKEVRAEIQDCGDVDRFAEKYGGFSGKIKGQHPKGGGNVLLDEIPPQVREQISSLSVGQTAAPVRSPSGFHILALCGETAMSRSDAFNSLMNERADRLADSYLEDLRRGAMLEIK